MNLIMETPPKVFISYSHDNEEHKAWVIKLATRLRSNGVDVILDIWHATLGSDLASFMEHGLSSSKRVICICSEQYVSKANEQKGGAGYEKGIMTAELVIDQNTNWIIPLIVNNPAKKTPTFLGARKYINFCDHKLYEARYEELLRDILEEPILPIPPIGPNPFKNIETFNQRRFSTGKEKYLSPPTRGKITFDYSNNNGVYSIGQGHLVFELMFSTAGNKAIHLYNDPATIDSIAIAKKIKEVKEINDARQFDYSSRTRTPQINEIAILQNSHGYFAAIKILSIMDKTGEDEHNEVTFEYFIQTNGSPDFSNFS